LLGNKIERTVRYLGIEVDDAAAVSRRLNYRAKLRLALRLSNRRWSANFGHRTGGAPSLGYQARDRKLVMVESEAKIASSSAAMPNSARYDC
jgi:hypothetical protein